MLKTFDKERLILVIIFLLSLATSLILDGWVRSCGFMLTPDSYNYLAAAKSFKETGLFIGYAGNYYAQWPPMFPVILSLFDDPQGAMLWIFMLCKIITGIMLLLLANQILDKLFFKVLFLIATLFSVHLLLISVFLWSEMIFMMLFMIHVYLSLNLNRKSYYYYLLIVVAFLVCLQRNAGVFIIFATAVWLILNKSAIPGNNRMKSIFYVVLSVSGLVCWMAYLTFFIPIPFYNRVFFADAFLNTELIFSTLGHSVLPMQGKSAALAGIIIICLLVGGWYAYLRSKSTISLTVLTTIIYSIGFISVSDIDREMDRFFAIILPVFLLLVIAIIEHISCRYPRQMMILAFFLVIESGYWLSRTTKNAFQWHEMSCGRVSHK